MPELVEVEIYRRQAEALVGRRITAVACPDAWFLRRGTTAPALQAALVGRTVTAAVRVGKVLLLHTDDAVLGIRFGMTGRLLVDGSASIDALLYSSDRDDPAWDRFVVGFDGGGELRVRDPRRLGGVELDPALGGLGPDARSVGRGALRRALQSSAAVKACLLDQGRIAGVGNLIADEVLWRASIDPTRSGDALHERDLRRLHRHLVATIDDLLHRGGSHTGDLMPERRPGGRCPLDGAALLRSTVGGRTTWSCPTHQR